MDRRRRTLFPSERSAWIGVGLYTAILYSTLGLAFDLYVHIFDQVGKAVVSLWMNRAFAALGLVLLVVFIRWYRPRLHGYLTILLVGLGVAFCLFHLEVPAKRFHFLQYGPLTLLVFDALRFRLRGEAVYPWAMATVALIGLGDETIQGLLPDRHFGVLDLMINSCAGLAVLALIGFVVGEEQYPFPPWRRTPEGPKESAPPSCPLQ